MNKCTNTCHGAMNDVKKKIKQKKGTEMWEIFIFLNSGYNYNSL